MKAAFLELCSDPIHDWRGDTAFLICCLLASSIFGFPASWGCMNLGKAVYSLQVEQTSLKVPWERGFLRRIPLSLWHWVKVVLSRNETTLCKWDYNHFTFLQGYFAGGTSKVVRKMKSKVVCFGARIFLRTCFCCQLYVYLTCYRFDMNEGQGEDPQATHFAFIFFFSSVILPEVAGRRRQLNQPYHTFQLLPPSSLSETQRNIFTFLTQDVNGVPTCNFLKVLA